MPPSKTVFAEFDPLKDLIDNTSEVVMMLSPDLKFLFVNKAFRDTLGYSSEEAVGLSFSDILHPQYKDEVMIQMDKVKNGEIATDFQMIVRTKDKKRRYLLGEITCRFEKDGSEKKPINYRCLFRNITQRRRAERAQDLYYSIAEANLKTHDLKDFLKNVHEELQKKIYANNFFVAIYERENGTIFFPYRVDEHYPTPENDRRKLGNGVVEYALVKNKPLLFYKKEFEEIVKKEKIFLYGRELPEVQVIVPLILDGKTTGVIGIKSYSDATKFSSRNLELLEFISGQVAQAMEKKQAQAELLLQTSRLNAVFDSSSHLIWTVDEKRQLSSFNKNYYNWLDDKLGQPPIINVSTEKLGWKLIAPEDRPLLREMYKLAFEGKPQYFEMHWGAPNGGPDWFEFYLNPILSSENGKITEVSGIARNITEKKNATISIEQSEEKFRNIVESFIDIYYRTDLAGNLTMISPSVYRHTGYTLEEVMGHKVDKFFKNVKDSSGDIKELLKAGNITNFDVTVKRKDGELRQFMLNIRLIKNAKGFPVEVEGIARDISELKKTAKDLQDAKEVAEHSLAVKERFLANMSHEIRTPMNGIIGMIDVLNETKLGKEQKDYIHTIRKSSQTLLTILNDILDLSKIEAGKMNIHAVHFELKELLKTLVALFSQRAFEQGNAIHFEIESSVPKYFHADQTRILQILSNLTSNAIKFTEQGAITILVKKVSSQGENITLKFEVIDEGIGISEEDQKVLFNAFQQLDNSTSKSFGGTGLGLAISRELSKRMNGDMGIESKIDEGSTFWFTSVLKVAKESPKTKTASDAEIKLTGYFEDKKPKLLLVDDNAINRKVANEILKRSGCLVTEADSGQKALDLYEKSKDFDLILMDIQMPEMDGIEATAILRQKFKKTLPNVVAMTAYSMKDDREKFLNSGFDSYVSKPIRAHTLVKTVEEMIPRLNVSKSKKAQNPKKVTVENDFKNSPSFDMDIINSLKEMVGAEMLHSVFEDFRIEAKEQIEKTAKAYKNKDVKTIQQELHTLKGNSGTIGLMRMHEIVKQLEVPAKTGVLQNFEANFKLLQKEFDTVKKDFNSL